jgi:hypothetical protein
MSPSREPGPREFPESNADEVARKMIHTHPDIDGTGLVQVCDILLKIAENSRNSWQRGNDALQKMMNGEQPLSQEEVDASLLYGLYESACLKWFLSRAFLELSNALKCDFVESMANFRPIRQITFTDEGEAESFRLE